MEKLILARSFALFGGLLLVLPSLYFIVSALLNFTFGFPALWNLIRPVVETPVTNSFGFNVNLLILFDPLLAILISLPEIVKVRVSNPQNQLSLSIVVFKRSYSWIVFAIAAFCLLTLLVFSLAESCLC